MVVYQTYLKASFLVIMYIFCSFNQVSDDEVRAGDELGDELIIDLRAPLAAGSIYENTTSSDDYTLHN